MLVKFELVQELAPLMVNTALVVLALAVTTTLNLYQVFVDGARLV